MCPYHIIQDCSSEYNALAGIVSCGGVVRDASVELYESPVACCKDQLSWIDEDDCVETSIRVETGWLNEMLEQYSD